MRSTLGLCGYMDDIASNDLKAPDGTVYNISESTNFVESCEYVTSL